MESLTLLCGFGITFFLQHKAYHLLARLDFFKRMLECTFCIGVHGGWIAYVLCQWTLWADLSYAAILTQSVAYAFAGGAFTYVLDTVASYWERE